MFQPGQESQNYVIVVLDSEIVNQLLSFAILALVGTQEPHLEKIIIV